MAQVSVPFFQQSLSEPSGIIIDSAFSPMSHYWYNRHLAYVHDVGFGGYARQSVPGILEILNQYHIHQGLIVELGCGSGITAHALTQAGYHVLGIVLAGCHSPLAKF